MGELENRFHSMIIFYDSTFFQTNCFSMRNNIISKIALLLLINCEHEWKSQSISNYTQKSIWHWLCRMVIAITYMMILWFLSLYSFLFSRNFIPCAFPQINKNILYSFWSTVNMSNADSLLLTTYFRQDTIKKAFNTL